MNALWKGLAGLALAVAAVFVALQLYGRSLEPGAKPGSMALIESNHTLVTVNTTRIGSDDPIETAVAVAQIVYPVTEEENSPGAVILVNRNNLAEVLVAASRVQHFPVNAPLLFVDENSLPELTRSELLRLKPEGVPMDSNVQVYLIGTIGESVRQEVERLGFKTRALQAADPIELAALVDDWTSTQHGDHANAIAIANIEFPEAAVPSAFWNAHMGQGLAYVTSDGIPEATRGMLERRANGPWLYLFGDETIIPDAVARQLAQYGHVTRMPRATPSEISVYFAGFKDIGADWGAWFWQASRDFGWGISEAGHNIIVVSLDGPAGWQNAITASTLSHMGKHAPVIILPGDEVPEGVVNYLQILKPYPTAPQQQLLNHAWIIGGEETLSWSTQLTIDSLLEAYPTAGTAGTEGGAQ